ncbi:hypothetical protein IWZ00DRAFT_241899 [Phyllosticta capitalensis]|uniref:uncharacterized protein n=1 Tax=Phyllosticta capitalensis TaxID=121624 RepID=UPI003131B4EF
MHRAIEARVGSPRNFLFLTLTFFKNPLRLRHRTTPLFLSPTLPSYSPLPDSPRSHCDRRPHLSPSTSRHATPRTVRNMRHTVRTVPHRIHRTRALVRTRWQACQRSGQLPVPPSSHPAPRLCSVFVGCAYGKAPVRALLAKGGRSWSSCRRRDRLSWTLRRVPWDEGSWEDEDRARTGRNELSRVEGLAWACCAEASEVGEWCSFEVDITRW